MERDSVSVPTPSELEEEEESLLHWQTAAGMNKARMVRSQKRC